MANEKEVISETPETVVTNESKETPGDGVQFFENQRRKEVEQKAILENDTVPPKEEEDSTEADKRESLQEDDSKEEDPVDKIKRSVQKRIDKEVARRKSLEDELTELREKLSKIESSKSLTQDAAKVDEKREPTDAEIRSALKKAREDGDVEFETQIIEFMTERKANRIADERINKIKEEENKKLQESQRIQTDWTNLQKDYLVYDDTGKVDMKHELNLANQDGLLYKTAMKLYQDPELQKDFYGDPNKVFGFRRAVADAYREIHQQGLYKPAKKVVNEVRVKQQLADPGSDMTDDAPTKNMQTLSDVDKAREEVKRRKKILNSRMISP